MEKLTKKELIDKWKSKRDKLYIELNFCVEHKFDLETELIRKKIELLGDVIFDLEYCLT